jgi:uncharacterized coiled-coil protein SlyX
MSLEERVGKLEKKVAELEARLAYVESLLREMRKDPWFRLHPMHLKKER